MDVKHDIGHIMYKSELGQNIRLEQFFVVDIIDRHSQ